MILVSNTSEANTKRLRVESQKKPNFFCSFTFKKVVQFLEDNDLLILESVSKEHRENRASDWQILAKRDWFTVDWHDAENKPIKEKYNYILCKKLFLLLEVPLKGTSLEEARRIDETYGKYSQFPHFNAYVKLVVGQKRNAPYICSPELLEQFEKINKTALQGILEKKWTADIILHGLILCRRSNQNFLNGLEFFILAAKLNGFVGSQLLGNSKVDHLRFAIECAKNKSYEQLDDLLEEENYTLDILYNLRKMHGNLPPILFQIGISLYNYGESIQESETFFEEAEKSYGDQASISLYDWQAYIKIKLGKYKEAEKYVNIVLMKSGFSYSCAFIKFKNKNYSYAEEILENVEDHENVNEDILLLACIKKALDKHIEAQKLFNKFFSKGDQPSRVKEFNEFIKIFPTIIKDNIPAVNSFNRG